MLNGWAHIYNDFKPEEEGHREALFVLGNGYFATRGAGEESEADGIHYPGTYLAGGYNRLITQLGGETIENEDLVNFPNWLPLNFRINQGPWFSLSDVKILSFQQKLNMLEGILTRDIHFRDRQGFETKLTSRRLVSMHDYHLAGIQMIIHAENWQGEIEIVSALDGKVINAGVERYRQLENRHLKPFSAQPFGDEGIYLQVTTSQSHIHMAQVARTRLFFDGKFVRPISIHDHIEPDYVAKHFRVTIQQKQSVCIEKIVTLYTSRDFAISECGLEARQAITRAPDFDQLLNSHRLAWQHLWKRFDIDMESPAHYSIETLAALRLNIFHLLQTVSLHTLNLDAGVPARGWHGEAYRGHILWDELFVFPTLNLQIPEITRTLLLYRYRRLPAARWAAKQQGWGGAMYPWQSASNGREESQRIHLNPISNRWVSDHTYLQHHVNSAIAFNIWQHFEATGDIEFMTFYGAEMLLEIAKFWECLIEFNAVTGRYEIHGVMGPDEFHDAYPHADKPGINNNAYTNVMVVWVFARALQVMQIIPTDRRRELQEYLTLSQADFQKWDEICRKMLIPFHKDGIISQFEGYEDLQELDWDFYRKKYKAIDRLDRILEAEGDSPNNYKLSKQADVLMLFYLFSAEELRQLFYDLGYSLKPEIIRATVDYYIKRTSHGSSLSRVVHSWVESRSNRDVSWGLFYQALTGDIKSAPGRTTSEGIHLGAMAGTIDLVQRCYTGIEFRGNVLRFNPCLPKELKRISTIIRYRGHSLSVNITHEKLMIRSARAAATAIQIAYGERSYQLNEGQVLEIILD